MIGERYEHVRRDGWGEILGGGNTFVFCSYETETHNAMAAPYVERCQKAELDAAGAA